MKSIQGASFYDSLAMTAIGILVCHTANDIWFGANFPSLFSRDLCICNEIVSVTFLLTISFFIGLILNKTMEWLYGKIEKCCCLFNVTKKMRKTMADFLKKPYILEKSQSQPCTADFFLSESGKTIEKTAETDSDEEIRAAYNWCYFRAEKNGLLTTVHILEAQIAFLRNALPVGIFIIGYYADIIHTVVAILILLFVAIDLLLWNAILKKQLYLVWEAGLSDMKRDECVKQLME
ncbi:MAG: hypothetical protein IKW86_03785 [Salinivirgaceae bacterium]|nr:hypothetical protein [Salinivirgaceae bacterium]